MLQTRPHPPRNHIAVLHHLKAGADQPLEEPRPAQSFRRRPAGCHKIGTSAQSHIEVVLEGIAGAAEPLVTISW